MYYMYAHGVECKRMWLCDCVIANGSHWSLALLVPQDSESVTMCGVRHSCQSFCGLRTPSGDRAAEEEAHELAHCTQDRWPRVFQFFPPYMLNVESCYVRAGHEKGQFQDDLDGLCLCLKNNTAK